MATEIPTSTAALTEVIEVAGRMKIPVPDIMKFARTMIDLGNSTDLSASQAAETLTKFANVTQMSKGDFDRLGSALTRLGNNMQASESEIATMAMRLAAAGTQIGLSKTQILGFAAGLSSVGIEAEAGGSAFSKLMVNIQLATEKGGDSLEGFANVAGLTSDAFTSMFKSDPSLAIQAFIVGLSKMDEQGISAIKTLDDMGLSEVRLRDTLLRSANANEVFTNSLNLANDEWDKNTALSEEAAKVYNTTASKLEILKSKGVEAARMFGEKLAPTIDKLIGLGNGLLDAIRGMDSGTAENILKFAALVAAIGPVVSGVGTLTRVIGGLMKGLSLLSSPLGLAAAAVGVLGFALYGLIKNAKSADDALNETLSKNLGDAQLAFDSLTVEVPTPTIKYAEEGVTLIDGIYALLTDGMKDTEKQKEQMKTDVNTYIDTILSDVTLDESQKLQDLKDLYENGFIDAATYTEEVGKVIGQSALLKKDLETLRDETLLMVENLSGAPTKAVQAQFDKIEELKKAYCRSNW